MARSRGPRPLPPSVFHILLALGDEEQHGYAIMRRIGEITDGAVHMGPGTLYGSIKRMLAEGLIEEVDERPDATLDNERRRYYRVTGAGAHARSVETRRMQILLRHASPRLGDV